MKLLTLGTQPSTLNSKLANSPTRKLAHSPTRQLANSPTRKLANSRNGFTLLEMLVVVVIIVILMGVVFRLSKGAMTNAKHAKEVARVATIKALIEEFHSEYGCYPPVPEYDGIQPVNYIGAFSAGVGDLDNYASNRNGGDMFKFGLLSFFIDRISFAKPALDYRADKLPKRERGETAEQYYEKLTGPERVLYQWNMYNESYSDNDSISKKDEAFIRRVKPLLAKLGVNPEPDPDSLSSEVGDDDVVNGICTSVHDSFHEGYEFRFGNDRACGYVYISKPPYTSYLFFSMGDDQKFEEPADDRTLPLNRDNVYGDLGDK